MKDSIELIVSKLEALAVSLGTTVENIFPFFVQREIVEGIVAIGFIAVVIILFVFIYKLLPKILNKDLDIITAKVSILIIGAVFCFITVGVNLHNIVDLFAPEAAAIKQLTRMVITKQ